MTALHVVSCPSCGFVATTPRPDSARDGHAETTGHDPDVAPLCDACRECPATFCDYCREVDHCDHHECMPVMCASAWGRDKADELAGEVRFGGRWT